MFAIGIGTLLTVLVKARPKSAPQSETADVVVLESCCGHYDPRDPYIENGRPLDVDSEALWQVFERRVDEAIRLSRDRSAAVIWRSAR